MVNSRVNQDKKNRGNESFTDMLTFAENPIAYQGNCKMKYNQKYEREKFLH